MATNFQDTDALVIARGPTNYKATYSDLKESLGRDGIGATDSGTTPPASPENGDLWLDTNECPPELKVWSDCSGSGQWEGISSGGGDVTTPIIDSVTFTEDTPGGSRFSGQSFTADVTMFSEGTPTSQKEYSYKVTTDYTGTVSTDPQSSANNSSITFSSSNNLNQLGKGDVISIAPPGDISVPRISSVTYDDGSKNGGTDGIGEFEAVRPTNDQVDTNDWRIESVFNVATNKQVVMAKTSTTNKDSFVTTNGLTYSKFRYDNSGSSGMFYGNCTSYCLETGQSILNADTGELYGALYSENGTNWSPTPGTPKVNDSNYSQGFGVSSNRMWQWYTGEMWYSTNKGASWTQVTNPLYPASYSGRCAIDFGPHLIYWGLGPSNQGVACYLITNKNSNLTSISEYQVHSTPFTSQGPLGFSAYVHPGCDGGFFCVGSSQSGLFYSTDAGISWQTPTSEGMVVGTTNSKDSLMYDTNTGWYYYITKNYDFTSIWQSRDPQQRWISMGKIKSIPSVGANSYWKFIAEHNRFVAFYEGGSNTHYPAYLDVPNTPGTIDFTIDFKDPADATPFFARTDIGVGTYISQSKNTGLSTAVITDMDAENQILTCRQAYYGTYTTFANNSKFDSVNTDIISICETQHGFGINSINGTTASGVPLILSVNGAFNLSTFNSSIYESEEKLLVNAYRYLAIEPNGDVTGYLNGPDPKFTYLLTDTINFPTNAPTGNSWDVELPAGATLTVGVAADNTAGGGARNPALGTFDASVTPGVTKSVTKSDAVTSVLNFKTFDYRTDVYRQDLVDRGAQLRTQLKDKGYTDEQITEAMNV